MIDDLAGFIETVRQSGFFEHAQPITISRAPGRLDVMGGFADYSGALVLQQTIAESTFAAVQRTSDRALHVVSSGEQRRTCSVSLSSFEKDGTPIGYEDARKLFAAPDDRWAAYVLGVFPVLMRERGIAFSGGARILISSSAPEGKGVASSAALEVATMQAVAHAFDVPLLAAEMAILCQKVENLIAAAPCGIMDQMTSACGETNALLALLCQPAELQPAVKVPEQFSFWGLDSGERHAISGSDYGSVRTAAFMGYRLLANTHNDWNGYLANITPREFEDAFLQQLPEEMTGKDFLALYSGTTDTVTRVDPMRVYKVRQATAHPIYEHDRVRAFRQLILGTPGEDSRVALGRLMYKSHESYSACGLGSAGTDLLVRLVQEAGSNEGLYGARVTGGGSGGTVAILGDAGAQQAIDKIVESYERLMRYRPYVFSGSSPGAVHFGATTLNL